MSHAAIPPPVVTPKRFKVRDKITKPIAQTFTRQRCRECPDFEVLRLDDRQLFVCQRSDREIGPHDCCALGFRR
jgi:hypothetical protein